MLTKRKIIVLAITGVIAAMITGGAVMAQEGGSTEDSAPQSFASRVATILNLDEGVVQDALSQAREEIRDERFQMKLDRLVEQGRIDQAQADELRDWYQSRPDSLSGFRGFHGRGSFGRHGLSRFGGFGHAIPGAPPSDSSGSTTSY